MTIAVLTAPLLGPASQASAATMTASSSTPRVVSVHAGPTAHALHVRHVAERASRGAHRTALGFGQRVVAEASRHLGAPYEWGATGPSTFDCSGFTGYVYARLGISLPRVAADQYAAIRHVSSPAIGDLIFNYGSGGIYHVGIYAGDGQMIAATHTGDVVRRESLYGNYHVGRVN